MALQTSGAISLNDIHVEAGGSSGTSAAINDQDIRDLISKGSGVQMAFSEWYGASSVQPFASWTTSWSAVESTSVGKTFIYSAPLTNATLPLRGGYQHTMSDAVVDQNGYTGLNLPTIINSDPLASNAVYQFYLSVNPTLVAGPYDVPVVNDTLTETFWALDPVDFGYQSATFQGLTTTFHKATTADIPAPDADGRIMYLNGLAIKRSQTGSGFDNWSINLAGTVTGTAINGASWNNGNGFNSGTASITGLTLTLNGYS